MPKMSLERFREIKNRTSELLDLINKIDNEEITLTEDEEQTIQEDFEQLNDEIHSSDLSDIPFEEYEGFNDLDFNFEGTGANIDFNIMDSSIRYATVRLKGCHVRNFDFDSQSYDDESFDEEFMRQHQERFLDKEIPDDVKKRYYRKLLSVEDILKYNLYDEISKGRVSEQAGKFFSKIPTDIARTLDTSIFESWTVSYSFMRKIEEYEGEVTETALDDMLREIAEETLSRPYLSPETYKELVSISKVRELIPDNMIIDFGDNDNLAKEYLYGDMPVADVYSNKEMFRGKKFVQKLSDYEYSPSTYEGITEEKLYYIFDNFPDVCNGLIFNQKHIFSLARSIDLEASSEENLENVRSEIIGILNSNPNLDVETQKTLERYYSLEAVASRLDEYDRYRFDTVMKHTTQEKIESYGISPMVLEDSSVVLLFSNYGLETVMEFDKANGNVFSKDDFALARKMGDYYFHYAGNEHDPNKTIFYRSDNPEDYTAPYTMEDFEECVRRMIVEGPSDYNYSKLQPINFGNFSPEFKERFPRMFLPEEAAQELQDKFYTKTLDIGDLGVHPDWINYLEGKDFEVGMQMPNIYFRNPNDYKYFTFFKALRMLDNSESNLLRFMNINAKTIKMAEMYYAKMNIQSELSLENIKSIDDLRDKLEAEVETKILSGALEYGEPYIPDFFKEKYSNLVLDENAPEELKAKFYSLYYEEGKTENTAKLHKLALQDLVNEEYQPFLLGKSFDLIKDADIVKNITKIFDIDTITDLYKIDPSAFELYGFNIENTNTLKEALEAYPEQYAREELMQGLKLSDEQFESRLQESEFKAKFESLKRGYVEDFVRNPGFVLHLDPEKRSREALRQYKTLSSSNMLHSSNRYSRDSYEQILGHMLGFLGYEESKKLLEAPEIDEDTLSRIYEQDEVIKSLYEKKFEISGNIKVIGKLLEGVPTLMPTAEKITSRPTCKIFMSINRRIQEGYDKDITSLLTEALAENNIEIDSDKINQLVERVIGISTAQKLDSVRENNSVLIDTNIEENQKTKNMIKMHYKNALEYSLKNSETVDSDLVREYLEREFSRVKENGEPYYSAHVTEHLEELVSFSGDLSSNPEWSEKLNQSIVDDLKEESGKIGKGWIRKLTTNVCYKPEKMTYEEAERLDQAIYPEGSGIEVETKPTIGLRELSEEEKSKLYELLTNDDYRGLFTYGKAENMFSTLKLPYSQKFKEFFLKNKDEFIGNPDLYTKFPILASKFDSYLEESGFNTRYTEGTLTPEDLLLKLSTDVYPNLKVGKGEHEVVYQARNAGLTEEQAEIALKLFQDMKKREYQTIPQEQAETKRYRGRIVRMDDPLHFVIGEITNCCQTIGENQPGESSMIHSATERNGALFVVEELDEIGKPIGIVSQSWTWRNGNRVCFDNVEIPHKVESQLKQIGGFDEIMEVYQETAKRMIETDKIKMKKLLEQGKITEQQYQSMVIKDVGMGLGCDDLVRNLSADKRATIPNLMAVAPLEAGKTYIGAHSRTLYSDAANAVLIAHNDEFGKDDHIHRAGDVGDYGVRYTKTRDIFRRKGFDIDTDKIESISTMVQKNDRESAFKDNPTNISEIASCFGICDLGLADADRLRVNMSDNGDWYILSEETENGIMILESGIDTSKPETNIEKQDRKMALSEYTSEIYKIMYEAVSKGKSITIDPYSSEEFVNLEALAKEGIISVENGVILVKDTKKLKDIIEHSNKIIDNQRRERLTITDKEEVSR